MKFPIHALLIVLGPFPWAWTDSHLQILVNFNYVPQTTKLNLAKDISNATANIPRGGLPYETDGDARRKFWI